MPRKEKEQQSAEQLQAEELEVQKARGDFVEGAEDAEEVQAAAAEEEEEPEAESDDVREADAEADGVLGSESEEESDSSAVKAAEEEEPEEVDEPGAKADETIMVPKGRLDEVYAKSREREEELQRRLDVAEKRGIQETTSENVDELETELDTLDSKYAEFLLEGELEKAGAVRKEWRQKQNDLFDIRLEQRSSLASQQAIESMRFDRQLAEYEVKFPVINIDSEIYDPEMATEVAQLMDAFKAQGWNPVAALNKAVKYVVPDEEALGGGVDPDLLRTKRQAAARKKVADVAKKSPPDLTDKGRDTDKVGTGDGIPDVTKMTPEQFAKLSDTQLSKLRGDTVTDQEVA
jgi:hypothetical protein